jgi:hypothetical protein
MNQNKIKELHHAGRLPASGVSQLGIEYHHNQWCAVNGYPVREASSDKRDATLGCIASKSTPKLQASSCKRQASSVKRSVDK